MNEQQLKTIKGAKYRVIKGDGTFEAGAIITFSSQDTRGNAFYTQEGNSYGEHVMFFPEIELIELPEDAVITEKSTVTVTEKGIVTAIERLRIDALATEETALESRVSKLEGAAEHASDLEPVEEPDEEQFVRRFTVGQKARVNRDYPSCAELHAGDIVTIKELLMNESYRTEDGWSLHDSELAPIEKHITAEEFAAIEVGDKFILRKDIDANADIHLCIAFNESMYQLAQDEVELECLEREGLPSDRMRGVASDERWLYTAEMIAKVLPKPVVPKFKVGDIVGDTAELGFFSHKVVAIEDGKYITEWADGTPHPHVMRRSFKDAEELWHLIVPASDATDDSSENAEIEWDCPDPEVGRVYVDSDGWTWKFKGISNFECDSWGDYYVYQVESVDDDGDYRSKSYFGITAWREANSAETLAFAEKAE